MFGLWLYAAKGSDLIKSLVYLQKKCILQFVTPGELCNQSY